MRASGGARSLSETCADILPPVRGAVQKRSLTVTSGAGEFSRRASIIIRRAHRAPLDSIRICFFLFVFRGDVVSLSFLRPTKRKLKHKVLRHGDVPNLIALRDTSSRAVITRHFPCAETLVASFFGHVALTQRFRFRFRRPSSFVVVVERIRSSYGDCLHLGANF